MHSQEIVIESPVHGDWAVYNPPGHPVLAFDLLAVDAKKSLYRQGGFLRHLTSFISVEDTHTWGAPVFSPVDGIVVASHDSEPDRKRISFAYDLVSLLRNKPEVSAGFGAFGGNHVMVQAGDRYVLLCHLRQGSATLKPGDAVIVGQKLGEVGNSGSSIQPHLHLQVMNSPHYFPLFANLLPFKVKKGQVKERDGWSAQENIGLTNRAHYRF